MISHSKHKIFCENIKIEKLTQDFCYNVGYYLIKRIFNSVLKLFRRNALSIFGAVATTFVALHVAAAAFGFCSFYLIKKGPPDGYVPSTDLKQEQRAALRKGLYAVLKDRPFQYVILGDDNHADLRQIDFLADPKTVRLFAKLNVKKVALEAPPSSQERFDSVAKGEAEDINLAGLRVMGPAVGKEEDKIESSLIRNTQREEIKVLAADANTKTITTFLFANLLAVRTESRLIEMMGFDKAAECFCNNVGLLPYYKDRTDDRETARFIREASGQDRCVILRGNGHIVVRGKRTLRENLSDCITFSFYDPNEDKTGQPYGSLHRQARLMNSFNPPDFILNLQDGTVVPYPKNESIRAQTMSLQ